MIEPNGKVGHVLSAQLHNMDVRIRKELEDGLITRAQHAKMLNALDELVKRFNEATRMYDSLTRPSER